jgi:hypothetical protein
MKRIALAFLVAMLIGGCGFFPTPVNPTPTVDNTSTPTDIPETATVLPTETSVPVTETFTPTAEVAFNPTITPAENLTTTPVTATSGPIIPTETATVTGGTATMTPTNGVLTYGTLPPAVPFNTVVLVNKSKEQVYISMQQQDGKEAILEYPVKGQVYVDTPLGQYIYVAWVGGKKMTGKFRVDSSSTLYITIFKDRIVIDHL